LKFRIDIQDVTSTNSNIQEEVITTDPSEID